jgi:hypothetical protein
MTGMDGYVIFIFFVSISPLSPASLMSMTKRSGRLFFICINVSFSSDACATHKKEKFDNKISLILFRSIILSSTIRILGISFPKQDLIAIRKSKKLNLQ